MKMSGISGLISCVACLILLSGILSAAPESYSQVRVYLDSPDVIQQLAAADVHFDHVHREKDGGQERIVAVLNRFELTALQQSGVRHEVMIADMSSDFLSRPQLSREEMQRIRAGSRIQGFEFGSMGGFYTLAEAISELDSMRLLYPHLITARQSIGSSHQGRDIWMVKISDNPDVDENEPEMLYNALHHAREPQSLMTVIYFMYHLLENYGSDPEVTYLVDNRELYFVPVINPDGYEYNRQTNPNGGGYWRKNRRNNGNGSYGVDLNRNYGHQWGYDNTGSSPSPGSDTYRGPSPFSEPETQAIRDFCNTRQFKIALNYHTYSDLLIYPWGYIASFETPDSLTFREYAADMTQFNGYTYGTGDQTVGYLVNGDSDDWMYGEQTSKGKILSMTPEVGNSGDGFWPSQSRIYPLAEENVYPNMFAAWAVGEFVKYRDFGIADMGNRNGYPDPGETIKIAFNLKNLGLSDATGVSVAIVSNDPYITIPPPANRGVFDIPARGEAVSDTLVFAVAANAPQAHLLDLQAHITFNGYTLTQSVSGLRVGTPAVSFADAAEGGTANWSTGQGWNTTTSQYHSPARSFTDSPSGDYSNSANNSLSLQSPLDFSEVTAATLEFWTKWDIEPRWDFAQVLVSTNGSSWTPLQGQFTKPGSGSGVQTSGEPGYDGLQSQWVKEQMDLSGYAGAPQLYVRFRLRSDGSVRQDGWYIDDITVRAYGSNSTYGMGLSDGWNLVSLPLSVSDAHYLTLFPDAVPGSLYRFAGSYVSETELVQGTGYWLRYPFAHVAPVSGQPVDALQIPLDSGWNLVGGISCDVPVISIADPGNIIVPNSVYGFNGAYYSATVIEQGQAYWIRADQAGEISLSCAANVAAKPAEDHRHEPESLQSATRVVLQDAVGNRQTLYLNAAVDAAQVQQFILPPTPPPGVFDARFTGGYRALAAAEATVELQSGDFPLTVSLNQLPPGAAVALTALAGHTVLEEWRIAENQPVIMSNPAINRLRLRSEETVVPAEFAVTQNYPNPFNPATTIRYAIPEKADVQVVVYNSLGQKVRTLFSGRQDAGNYTVTWYGDSAEGMPVSSGVYYFRVTAGEKVATRKMLLLR